MEKYTIENLYKFYLEKIGLDEKLMPPQQRHHIKTTFFGASGTILKILKDEISLLPEQQGVEILDNMTNEIGDYFINLMFNKN